MKRTLYILCSLLMAPEAFSWGSKGHMIVAKIAEDRLTPSAMAAVRELLPDQDLARASTWADQIRGQAQWKHTGPWHYVDIPDGHDYEDLPHTEEGDLIQAIAAKTAVLKSEHSSYRDKQFALKFIVHFVGDLHQPLHVGRPSDRGGNDVRIKFDGRTTNLHALWDSDMLRRSSMDHEEYADHLDPAPLGPPYDLEEISFSQIIEENMEARSQIYDFAPLMDGPIFIHESYVERNRALMDRGLLNGGKRLAKLLNLVFQ